MSKKDIISEKRESLWKISIGKRAAKKARKLPRGASSALRLLWRDLERKGPFQSDWPNFGKLRGYRDSWHCHLKKGKPTYVACWTAREYTSIERERYGEKGEIKIFYAWTHEDAPY